MERGLNGVSNFTGGHSYNRTILTIFDALKTAELGAIKDSERLSSRRST